MMTSNLALVVDYDPATGQFTPLHPPDANGAVLVVEYGSGQTVRRRFSPVTDITWDDLSGKTRGYAKSLPFFTAQPALGCTTGGDRVYARLMEHLCPTNS